ncbi:MAG: hypothetical protein H7Z17_07615 [Fuerstia sp.]|nr:hypothetical protein [Fuerstiella sp.]
MMSRIRFIRLRPSPAVGFKSQIPLLPPVEIVRPKVRWTAHTISTIVSTLLHTTIVCILAGIVIAGRFTETAAPLDATFTLEKADGGDLDFGNAEIEIDLPNENANPMPEMVVSSSIPVTAMTESRVALAALPSVESPASDKSGGAKRGRGAGKGKAGTADGPGESDNKGEGKVTFFGKEVQANSVAFVIDASKSMYGMRFQRARTELVNALSKLQPNQSFFVVFYTNETYPMFFPDNTIELIPADQRNLGRVFDWIGQSQVQGGTQPQLAIALTMKLKPDVVFFLSDGDIPPETQGIVKYHNSRSVVHTITFGSDAGAGIMRQIALRNGGEYRFIPDGF